MIKLLNVTVNTGELAPSKHAEEFSETVASYISKRLMEQRFVGVHLWFSDSTKNKSVFGWAYFENTGKKPLYMPVLEEDISVAFGINRAFLSLFEDPLSVAKEFSLDNPE